MTPWCLAAKLEIHSIHSVKQLLASFRNSLSEEEQISRKDRCNGLMAAHQNYIFPRLGFKSKLTDCEVLSSLMEVGGNVWR